MLHISFLKHQMLRTEKEVSSCRKKWRQCVDDEWTFGGSIATVKHHTDIVVADNLRDSGSIIYVLNRLHSKRIKAFHSLITFYRQQASSAFYRLHIQKIFVQNLSGGKGAATERLRGARIERMDEEGTEPSDREATVEPRVIRNALHFHLHLHRRLHLHGSCSFIVFHRLHRITSFALRLTVDVSATCDRFLPATWGHSRLFWKQGH